MKAENAAKQDLDDYLSASPLHFLLAIFIIVMVMFLTCYLDPDTMAGRAKNPGESLYIKNRVRGGATTYTPRAAHALKSKFTKVDYIESHSTMQAIALVFWICTCFLCYTAKHCIDRAALESEATFDSQGDQLIQLKSRNSHST